MKLEDIPQEVQMYGDWTSALIKPKNTLMENKYYTPDIEDLFVGYECEVYTSDIPLHEIKTDYRPMSWKKIVWNYYDFDETCFDEQWAKENIRTLYLTKEAIEAEGWKYWRQYGDIIEFVNKNDNISLRLDIATRKISIGEDLYYGTCPSINEFRKITKWLRI